jgi:hypothetical protein
MRKSKFFEDNGYLLLNDYFSELEIDNLRVKIKQLSNGNRNTFLFTSLCLSEKKIYEVIFNKKLVELYKEIIQDEVYLVPELHVQINTFPKNKRQGWHYDGQSERKHEYLKDPKRKFFRVGVYLQDNTEDYGGGIDILHNNLFKKLPFKINGRIEKLIIQFYAIFFSKKADTKKGSIIIFDSRLPHKGTFPLKNPIEKNFHDKYTIYFQVGNKEHCKYFIKKNIERMFVHYESDPATVKYFLDYLKLSFPGDYQSEFKNMLKENNIKLMSSDEKDSNFFKEFEKFLKISKN